MSEERVEQGPAFVDETLEEHRGCMKLVADVEDCLDRKPDDPVLWLENLRGRLKHLADSLRRHFKSEETGPLFTDVATSHPRLTPQLDRLLEEHTTMLSEIGAALTQAEGLERPEVFELRELNARIQLLVARIRRHEAEENELVLRAYWNETGVGD